jgi:spore germination protein GerM
LWLFPVKRQVNADAPLANALKALVKGATKAEERPKYHSSTFGIKFVSVSLKSGVVLARFTMPKRASFSGDNRPSIFREAVRKTAMQFKEVKKVIVSLDGDTNFGGEDGNLNFTFYPNG